MSAQAELIKCAAARASSEEATRLEQWAHQLRSSEDPSSLAVGLYEKLLQLI